MIKFYRITDAGDMESKYLRVISTSLTGLGLFLHYVSSAIDKKVEVTAQIKFLLNNKKFWKLAKHENPLVRQ